MPEVITHSEIPIEAQTKHQPNPIQITILILSIYSIAITGYVISNIKQFKQVEFVDQVHDYIHENSHNYSMYSFGTTWDNVYVQDAVRLWNARHPESQVPSQCTIKQFTQIIATNIMTRQAAYGQ